MNGMTAAENAFAAEGNTYATESVVFLVIFGLLDVVSADNFLVAVAVILLVGDKVRLPQKFRLVIFEFAHHLGESVC